MVHTYKLKEITWIDLNQPTDEEINQLGEKYQLEPSIVHDLISPTPHSRVDVYGNSIYTVLHFPAFKHSHSKGHNQEIDFVLLKNVVITARYDTIDPLERLAKEFEVESILNHNHHVSPLAPFFYIIEALYRAVNDELAYTSDWLSQIEKNIFQGQEKEMVFALSQANRNILNFKKTLGTHETVLKSLSEHGEKIFGKEFSADIRRLTSRTYRKLTSVMDDQSQFLIEMRETNNSLVSTKQNEIMKVLTILAFVTFPLSLIASIFGMNTKYIPIVGSRYDFWLVIGIMGFATLCMFVFFKHRKWL